MKPLFIGVLAFHGDVIEHMQAAETAVKRRKINATVIPVRTREDVLQCAGLIIPGGESTTLHTLSVREAMWTAMKQVPAIFGTCAGAIMLAKNVYHKAPGQQTLECMDISVDRNAYGRQTESFEKTIKTTIGEVSSIFIRAPKIVAVGKSVQVLAKDGNDILGCEQQAGRRMEGRPATR